MSMLAERRAAPEATAQSTENPAPSGAVSFAFEHKVFKLKPCIFARGEGGGEITMRIALDRVSAKIPLSAIRKHFSIAAGSNDDLLLAQVAQALRYVKEIRPGDSIPTEVTTGQASWLVEPQFRAIARAKLTMSLIDWLQGANTATTASPQEIMSLVERPETREKVMQAFDKIAESLGYPSERKAEIVDLVEQIASELCYIEALRHRFRGARKILFNCRNLSGAIKPERKLVEETIRVATLLKKPVDRIFRQFDEIDANTGEIFPMLREAPPRIEFIRKMRDELRETYVIWEGILTAWERFDPTDQAMIADLLRQTYRFAAQYYPQSSSW
ncbi:MAG: hypothetical protein FJX46_13530 [Alphaproteobacteria bacterium]|nr:hypothetical protein [Alphaproteobacteria bacterium]